MDLVPWLPCVNRLLGVRAEIGCPLECEGFWKAAAGAWSAQGLQARLGPL